MSESTASSESASGNATPEPTSKPKKSKSLLIMVAAIVIALILVSVVFLAVDWGGDDETPPPPPPPAEMEVTATIAPSGPVTVEAGESVALEVSSVLKNLDTDDEFSFDGEANVTYMWSKDPYDLGEFDLNSEASVVFTVAVEGMEGTVNCTVTYTDEDESAVAEVSIVVNPPYLALVTVVPATATLTVVEETMEFEAKAWDSVDQQMLEDVEFEWTVVGLDEGDYTLTPTTGNLVEFTALEMPAGAVSLNVTATSGDIEVEGASVITVTDVPGPERTLDYYWYDMFEVPFGSWYEDRAGEEDPWSYDEAPYIYNWTDVEINKNIWFYTMMRMDIDGAYMDEINMNVNPVFLPQGPIQGGTAVIDWYMQYITREEAAEYGQNIVSWYDGWIIKLTGTTELDYMAAQSVLKMPEDEWDTFDTWWDTEGDEVEQYWDAFLLDQGNVVYDIWTMFEWDMQPMVTGLSAEKVGDTVVVTHDFLSWGQEALMARWLRFSFMDDYEPYFDDFTMHAEIGPEYTNLSISTGIQYALYAYETTLEGEECWMWEALKGDYMESEDAPPEIDWVSEYDVYVDETYVNYAPGSYWYGEAMGYDYTPGILNLSEGETLSFEWPAGDQLFAHHVEPEVYTLVYGPMTVEYAEPMGTDLPGQVSIDTVNRVITYTGAIDMFTWSKTQTAHENLYDEWVRLGLLPYGMPTIEFRMVL